MKRFFRIIFISSIYHLSLISSAVACAVCFAPSVDSGLGRAFNFGIAILLGSTMLILSSLALTIYSIEKRKNRAERPG